MQQIASLRLQQLCIKLTRCAFAKQDWLCEFCRHFLNSQRNSHGVAKQGMRTAMSRCSWPSRCRTLRNRSRVTPNRGAIRVSGKRVPGDSRPDRMTALIER